jgi:hypothetical protein
MNYFTRQLVAIGGFLIGIATLGKAQQSWDRASAGPDYNPSSKPTQMAGASPVKVHVEQRQVRLLRCRTQLPEIESGSCVVALRGEQQRRNVAYVNYCK